MYHSTVIPLCYELDYIEVLTNGQIQFLDSLSVNYLLISPCSAMYTTCEQGVVPHDEIVS